MKNLQKIIKGKLSGLRGIKHRKEINEILRKIQFLENLNEIQVKSKKNPFRQAGRQR